MIKSFKTRIYPTDTQIEYFRNAFGVRRWVFNWALTEARRVAYEQAIGPLGPMKAKYPSYQDLQKTLNHGPKKLEEYQWLYDVHSKIIQEACKDVDDAIQRWLYPNKSGRRAGEPKYKSRRDSRQSCRVNNAAKLKYISPHYVTLSGPKKMKQPLKIRCSERMCWLQHIDRLSTVTVSEEAGSFYMSVTYEARAKLRKVPRDRGAAGIDMGIKTPLVIYDSNDKSYAITIKDKLCKAERRTETLNRALTHKREARKKCSKGLKRDSKRYVALKLRLQRAYAHEANIKRNWREQWSWYLVSHYNVIAIEPYSTKAADNLNCGRAARRAGGYEFYERLKQKAELYDTVIKEISWEPTTQTCSHCGHQRKGVNKVTLQERKYICPQCGFTWDRDANAARNIYELIYTAHGRWV